MEFSMISKLLLSFLVASLAVGSANASSLEEVQNRLQSSPYDTTPANNAAIYSNYCEAPNANGVPMPKYKGSKNDLVAKAAVLLAKTKQDADALLNEMGKEQFKQNLEYTVEALNNMITNSTNAQAKQQAQIILAEVQAPGVTSISKTAKDALYEMGDVLVEDLAAVVGKLAQILKQDLGGVDMVEFKKVANSLLAGFKKDLKGVDFAKLASTATKIQKAVEPKVQKLDVGNVISLTEQFLALIGDAPTGDLEYAKEEAEALLAAAKQGEQALNENAYYVSSMTYYFENSGIPVTPESEAIKAGFQVEAQKYNSIEVLNSINRVVEALTANPVDEQNASWITGDLVYTLQSINENNPQLAGNTDAEKIAFAKLAADYVAEQANFNTQDLISNAQSVVDYLASGDDQSALSVASSLKYNLENQMPKVSASTQGVVAKFLGEIAKNETEQIIATVNEVVDGLAAANNKLNEELGYTIQNMGYYVKETLPVKAQNKATLVAAINAAKQIEFWSTINSNMSSSIDMQESGHFYFYGGVRRLYRLSDKLPDAAVKAGANKEAHWFLTQLCGEFRDRATMIEAKLNWIQNLVTLAKSENPVTNPESLAGVENVWKNVNASAYYPYLSVVEELWNARRAAQPRYVTIGGISNIDNVVAGTTVCETKYIFSKYVGANKGFDSLESFNAGYEQFKGGCLVTKEKNDLTDLYDFRGDSNFKHYSPESNGMIWYATSVAAACDSQDEAKDSAKEYTSTDCQNYFNKPFYYRYNAARAGLSAWLFRDQKHADVFSSQGSMVAIYPHRYPELAPFAFGFTEQSNENALFDYDSKWLDIQGWNKNDIGFNQYTGLGSEKVSEASKQLAYELIRDAVDRHTDWYSSGFNDGNGVAKNQAYSPFVASSYVMSASDAFTTCGITVSCPPDGLKRWMFVFRIKAENFYNPNRIINNEAVNFDTMWFDETSFGVSGLADSENAWDRLGTAMESELDSILYLINVEGGGFEGGH